MIMDRTLLVESVLLVKGNRSSAHNSYVLAALMNLYYTYLRRAQEPQSAEAGVYSWVIVCFSCNHKIRAFFVFLYF